ncbi:MAG: hypothetical protein WAL38_14075 [Solirubrobacteraceae bacterium]
MREFQQLDLQLDRHTGRGRHDVLDHHNRRGGGERRHDQHRQSTRSDLPDW